MMTFKKKWIGVLASAMAFVVCCTFGVLFAVDTKDVSAETTSEYETYDKLYTSDFTVNGAANEGSWTIQNGGFLDFTPSAENASGSFVWSFEYTALHTTNQINIYSRSAEPWKGVQIPFDFNNLPITDEQNGFTEGQTYDVEYGVVKIKNTANDYYVYLEVDGHLAYGTIKSDGQGNGLYFYVPSKKGDGSIIGDGSGLGGIISSVRPEAVTDRLTNSDWTNVTDGATLPNEWATPSNEGKYLTFAPSEGNTTSSFVYNFDYLATNVGTGVNVYPFAGEYNAEPAEIPTVDTLSDLGGTFASATLAGLASWNVRTGNLVDPLEGTIAFKASGLAAQDGSLYVSLYHDPSQNAGQAADGIGFFLTANGGVHFHNCGGKTLVSNGGNLSSTETYTFTIGYKVADDYSTLRISVEIKDSKDTVITSGYHDVTSVNLSNFGTQTVAAWIRDHANAATHKTFFISTGASSSVTLQNVETEKPIPDTLSDLGGTFSSLTLAGLGTWNVRTGNLVDPMEGTIAFKASGLAAAAGSLYVSLYHDPSKNAGQAGDGIGFYLTANGGVYFHNCGGKTLVSNGGNLSSTETYTFTIGYRVVSDYSKIRISVEIKNSSNTVITSGYYDVTSVNLSDFGTQTVAAWIRDHANAATHKTFFISTGASTGVTLQDHIVEAAEPTVEEMLPQGVPAIDLGAYFTTAGEIYKVEIGVVSIDERLNESYRVYVTVNGVTVHDEILSAALKNGTNCGDGLFVHFNGVAAGVLVGEATTPDTPDVPDTPVEPDAPVPPTGQEYEYYDVLDNADWTLYYGSNLENKGTMPANWAVTTGYYIDFEPSAENTTGSYVWQFEYKVTNNAATGNFYMLSSGYYGSENYVFFHGTTNDNLTNVNLGVGTYKMEIGALRIKGSADQYCVYIKANDEIIYSRTRAPQHNDNCSVHNGCDKTNVSKHTGIYFAIGGNYAATIAGTIDDTLYETYDVLYNQNWTLYNSEGVLQGALPATWTATNGSFINFTPSEENTTASFIWKFKYKATGKNGFQHLYPLASGIWGVKDAVITVNSLSHSLNTEYDMELGVLKIKNSSNYYVFLRANGFMISEGTFARGHNTGDACTPVGCTDAECSKHTGIYFYLDKTESDVYTFTSPVDGDLVCGETYDVLYNSDWSVYSGMNVLQGEMPSAWSDLHDKFINFTPSENNSTGSFVWKFTYAPTSVAGVMNVYTRANAPWGSQTLFNFNNLGDDFIFEAGTTYDVEFGVLDIINSTKYYVFVKVDGEVKYSAKMDSTHNAGQCNGTVTTCSGGDDYSKHTGIYFYYDETAQANHKATIGQNLFYVQVNGEMQMLEAGKTLSEILGGVSGLIPADRPNGYSVAWYDDRGNKLTATTPIMGNATIVSTYTYHYTLVDMAGEVLQSHTHIYGNGASYNSDALTVDRTTFVGYLVGDALYHDLAKAIGASAASGKTIVAKTVTLGLLDGASIRIDGEPSIRFTATIDVSEVDANTQIVNFGMLLTTKDTFDSLAEFTIEGLSLVDDSLYHNLDKESGLRYVINPDYLNQYVYSLVLDKVSVANYGVQYVARAYAVVEFADGTQVTVYSELDEAANTRSMYEVASLAIDHTENNYTATQLANIQKRIDGVIDLADSLSGDVNGKTRNYDVAVTDNNDGTYTVKVTAKNGFDLSGIGAIYVGGEKIPVYDANLTAGTFVIKEEDMSVITLKKFNEFLAVQSEQRELIINAYSGPSLGLKVNSSGAWVNSGYDFTLGDLETYMAAGFDAWRLEISPKTTCLGYTAQGTKHGDDTNYDIYKALDLAAQYAQKYDKPCKVYVNIPEVTGLINTVEGKTEIQRLYNLLTNYDDGITKNLTGVSTVNGKNQIAGFLLKDEPKLSDATAFESIFKFLNDEATDKTNGCGAGAAGYDYQIALLQTYAGEANIGKDFNAYVETYAKILSDIDSIGFDSYPFGYKKVDKVWGSDTEEYTFVSDWFYLMEKYGGLDNGYTTCIQSYTAGAETSGTINKTTTYKTISSEAEISMQLYVALAYGFTNLDYFTYGDRIDYDKQVAAEVYQEVPVKWNDYSDWSKGYTTERMYDWMTNTNAEAISLYDALGKFTNNGVQLIKGTTSNNIFGSAKTTNTTNAIGVSSTYDMVVGGFKCGTQNGYLAVNADLPTKGNRTTTATFTLGNSYTKAIVYVDGEARVERVTNGTLTMNIGAGEGVFIVPLA